MPLGPDAASIKCSPPGSKSQGFDSQAVLTYLAVLPLTSCMA